jgi:homocysteine S-methyltransferase
MDDTAVIDSGRTILTEGAVIERLRRENALTLDPHILHAGFVFSVDGRRALSRIYTQYIAAGRRYDLPLMLGAPTWRASAERVRLAGLKQGLAVNAEAVLFLKSLRHCAGEYGGHILVAGMIACRHDAYNPQLALSPEAARRFHSAQIEALASGGPDLILAATLPALSEAEGLALALSDAGGPYLLSFVIRPDGTLLDGTPLDAAMATIDDRTPTPPAGYLVNCVHPDHLFSALTRCPGAVPPAGRLLGCQGNTSRLSPEALDGRQELDAAMPADFAAAMTLLHRRFGIRILGGCCGTDQRHIEALAAALESAAADAIDDGPEAD